MTSKELTELVRQTRERLASARHAVDKASAGKAGGSAFEWYPYDSLGNLVNLQRALGDGYLHALDASAGKRIADIGCGDGDLSFFLESLGCTVDAIDYPHSNHNDMRGVRALREQLGSTVQIAEVDLDSNFRLPRKQYDLAVFLGILYHLKNPLYVMERLAMHTRYCLLSTRVARFFPGGRPMPQDQPIAYLLGDDELNRDESNFWIFSHAGLKRLFARSYWKVLEYASVGDTITSTPVDRANDERVFCLLESHYGCANVELLAGFHEAEGPGWRWTKGSFSAGIDLTGRAGPDRIILRVFVPEELLARLGPRRMTVSIDGVPVEPAVFDTPGHQSIVRRFRARGKRSIVASFRLDAAIPADEIDDRERGIIVVALDCE